MRTGKRGVTAEGARNRGASERPLKDGATAQPLNGMGKRQGSLLLVALVATLSSALFFHETGNRLLTDGFALGMPINARAISCLANIIGIVAGFGAAAWSADRFDQLRKSQPFWIGFFAVQELLVGAFFLTFHPLGDCTGTLVVQFASGVSLAVFLAACIGFARYCSFAQFRIIVAAVVVLTVATTYGLFSVVAVNLPFYMGSCVQAAVVAVGAVCFLGFLRRSPRGKRKAADAETVDQSVESPFASSAGSRPLSYLVVILACYGAVFGFLHVIPLGLPTYQLPRVLPNLIGAAAAAILFVATIPRSEPTTTLVWNRIYRVSFPFVVLAALLIPYTSANEFVSSLSFVESAQFFFVALLITGCFVVCRTTGVGYTQAFSYAMLIYNAGFMAGDTVAMFVHDIMPLTDRYFGLIGIGVFLLLTAVTFNTNADKYAKTAWGIIPKETPKALYAKQRERRCEELASAHGLTAREREVLLLLAEGKRPKEISEIRTVSIATVRTHVQGIYSKLGVHSADELKHLVKDE